MANATNQNTNANEVKEGTYQNPILCIQCKEYSFIEGVCLDGCDSDVDLELHTEHYLGGFDHRDCPCSECRDYYSQTDPTDLDVIEFINIVDTPELPESEPYRFPIKLSDQFIMTCSDKAFQNRQEVDRTFDAVGNRKITQKTAREIVKNPTERKTVTRGYKPTVKNPKVFEIGEIGSASVVRDLSKHMMSVNVSSLDAVITADRYGDRPVVKLSEIEYLAMLDRVTLTESYLDVDLIDDFEELDRLTNKQIRSETGVNTSFTQLHFRNANGR
jgi:hypothetical protein